MIRFIHLSDFHLNFDNLYDAENFIIKALKKDLLKYHKEKPVDLIVFSGDLIDKGGQSFNNDLELAFLTFEEKIIEPILELLSLPKNRFFFCPGNHDIDRNADKKHEEMGICSLLTCTDKVNKFIESNLSKTESGLKRISKFKDFEKYFYDDLLNESVLTNFHSNFVLNLNSIKIGITCFNSCWRCYDDTNDSKNIMIGERQVIEARKLIDTCNIKIAIMHHSIDSLVDFDRKSIRNFIYKDYDLIFCGHAHNADSWTSSNYYGGVFVSIAPANWSFDIRNQNRVYANGYSVIDYDFLKSKIIVHHRRYNHNQERFDPNSDLGNDSGIYSAEIPKSGEMDLIHDEIQIATNIENTHLEEVNEHLLSYNTDTKAPKTIDELFVIPNIVRNIDPDPEKEEVFDYSDLLNNDYSFVIFGPKESGKTILLDKLLILLTKSVFKLRKIPIYINFPDIKGKKFQTIISRYLNVPVLKVDALLSNHRVIFLIDNLNFINGNQFELERLERFVNENKNIQVISTSFQTIEGNIPIDILNYPFFANFKQLFIKSFRTKEIKTLIKSWFSKSDLFETPTKLNKIIDFFSTLNLPRTPLSISMFLWIVEKHENYRPINHAVMLENFIERLFKKLSKNEIYSDVFDFTNKQRMLAEIAKEMYDKSHENYRISYQDLSNFIYENLKKKRFEFESDNVLRHFIEKGILVKESEDSEIFIRFRFTCFFQYFLMKHMDYNRDFLEYVLNENNYLYFTNEIDYLTGIKRDCSDILTKLISRMNQEYKDLIEIIEDLPNSYDEIFRSQEAMISKIGDDFVKKLPNKPREEEIEKITDSYLDSIKPEKGIKLKEKDLSTFQRLDRMWCLSAKVLKNTEETQETGLKDQSYNSVIKCSIAFAALYKSHIEQHIKKREKEGKPIEVFVISIRYLIPLMNEIALFSLLGTKKLSAVIRDKIKKDISNQNISDFEKFTSIFLYADIKGNEYERHINWLVKNIKHPFMYDMVLLKLLVYYFFESKSPDMDKIYLNNIADLLIRAKGRKKVVKGKVFKTFKDKSKIIEDYKSKKIKMNNSETNIKN